ncbi:MAG TPA: PaaI family thioesterase [Anaerolineae bacterium]|nr:PaaI family thioesterase [Anaerolineae bacterium]
MDDMLQIAGQILQTQPFSVLIGAEMTAFSPGHAELTIPVTAQLRQQHGFAHGGVLCYAADNALSFAGGSVLGPAILTSEFKINYLRPARGDRLVARASVVYAGRFQAVCRCDVFSVEAGEESLCAVAQGTIVRTGRPSDDPS